MSQVDLISVGVRRRIRRFGFELLAAFLWSGGALAQSLVPGHTPGEFSVTPSGAATYSIPIQVPPGVAGLVPSLSLNYSSQAHMGIAGAGWSLEGSSTVSRCPRTLATDGVNGSTNLNTDDRFCLDGMRLIVVSGTYGEAGSEYRTEIDQFIRITANGAANGSAANGPESFTVRTRDGRELQMGATADSRFEAQGRSVVSAWALTSISDVKGNAIGFSYTEDNASGSRHLNSVVYGDQSVQLNYETRPDIYRGYQAGSVESLTARLKQIETRIGAAVVLQTNLMYGAPSDTFGSRLISVQTCDATAKCLHPVTFEYPAISVQRLVPSPATPENGYAVGTNDYKYIGGDFNGDGRSDLLHFVSNDYIHVWLSNADGTFSIRDRFPGSSGYAVSSNNYNYLPGDFDGDGKTDLLHLIGPSQTRVWLSNGGGTFDIRPIYLPWAGYAVDMNAYRYEVGDFNGDGRADVIHFTHDTFFNVWLSNGDGTFSVKAIGVPWAGYHMAANNFNYKLADFNGDGLTDMIHFYGPSYTHVWLSKGDGTFDVKARFPETNGYGVGEPSQQFKYLVGDFNGDGIDDLIHLVGYSYVHVWLSKGDGTFAVSSPFSPWSGYNVSMNSYRYEVGDFDGDGKQDLVHLAHNAILNLWRSNGDGTFKVYADPHQWPEYPLAANNYRYLTGDFNGDRKSDLIHFIRPTGVHVWHSTFAWDDPIVSFTSGGKTTSVEYQGLAATGSESVYGKSVGSSYPVVDMQPNLAVVKSTAQSNGVGGSNVSHYRYYGMKAEHSSAPGKGRGNQGFLWNKVTDEASGMEVLNEFSQTWPFTGQVVKSETRRTGALNDGLLKRTESQIGCYQTMGTSPISECPAGATGLVYQVFPIKTTESSWDFNGATMPVIETTRALTGTLLLDGSIKQMGDITELWVDVKQGGALKHRKHTVNEYHPAKTTGTDWQIGRLKKATVTSTQY